MGLLGDANVNKHGGKRSGMFQLGQFNLEKNQENAP